MSVKSVNVSSLSSAFLLIENDFSVLRNQLKELGLIEFSKQLNESCAKVFKDQLLSNKELIESKGMRERLEVVKKNLESCNAVERVQDGESGLDFVDERASEVDALVRGKLAELGEKVRKFDRNLSHLCDLIDSHLVLQETNRQLAQMIASDQEASQCSANLEMLEVRHKELARKKHFSSHHKRDNEDLVKGIVEMRSRVKREQLLKGIVFVLEGLKTETKGCALEQVFAEFPPRLQWAIFKNAGIVEGGLPSSLDTIQPAFVPLKSMKKVLDTRAEQVGGVLLGHACKLFLEPEMAFVACVAALEGYEDALVDQAIIAGIRANYLNDVQAIEKKKLISIQSDPFEVLKDVIRLSAKSSIDDESVRKENIERLLLGAGERGLDLHGEKGVYFWVWFLAHQKDPSAGGLTFGQDNAHKDVDRLVLAIDEACVTPEQLLQRYMLASVASMGELKTELEKVKAHSLTPEMQEEVVRAILLAALRGEIALDKPSGVYHHVWAIASKTDSWAHGDNWGSNNAPKDIDRLLQAIELAQ